MGQDLALLSSVLFQRYSSSPYLILTRLWPFAEGVSFLIRV